MKRMLCLMLFLISLTLTQGQELETESPVSKSWSGYLYQTAITRESYVITNVTELKSFQTMLPAVTPYKKLPAPPNPDPLLHGLIINFEETVLIVAVGRNRITDPPRFEEIQTLENGDRTVVYRLPVPTAKAYPFGWAVYSAVPTPKDAGQVRVVVKSEDKKD